jgi:hypothetical protein
MKKLYLLIVLLAPPLFAQESGSPAVGGVLNEENEEAINIAAMPDGSVWYFYESDFSRIVIYCHVNESGNPRCEEVDIDD